MRGQAPFLRAQIKKIRLEKEDIFYIIAVIEKILLMRSFALLSFLIFLLTGFGQKPVQLRFAYPRGEKTL
jgi:hypothetical protein